MPAGALLAASEPAARVASLPVCARATAVPAEFGAGELRLGRRLSHSALSTVFESLDGGRRRVLKCATAGGRAGLRREYTLGRSFRHPNLVRPLAWYERDGAAGIVFDYLAGGDLTGLAGFAPEFWAGPLGDVAAALGYLHARGFVHGDVKARNVRLDDGGRAVLIDVGSCAPCGAPRGSVGSTPATALPPGQATADRLGPADDVYAFALLIREMLTPNRFGPVGRRDEATEIVGLVATVSQDPLAEPRRRLERLRRALDGISRRRRQGPA